MTLLDDLVARLQALPPAAITVPTVSDLLGSAELDAAALRPFIGPRHDHYARRRVHRGRHFEVLVLTWLPGQCTPIHNHAGNCGWVRLLQGRIAEETFRLVPGGGLPDAEVAVPAQRVGQVGLERTGTAVLTQLGAVATVDRQRAIHRLGNPGDAADVAVTLHVYSLPHDACLAFDLASRTCERRQMSCDPPPC